MKKTISMFSKKKIFFFGRFIIQHEIGKEEIYNTKFVLPCVSCKFYNNYIQYMLLQEPDQLIVALYTKIRLIFRLSMTFS